MEAINEVNELLTTKLCSPVIIYGVVAVISLIGIYFIRQSLERYNTHKMDNLKNLFSMQEVKYLIVLGIIMYGLCQYNKTDLAWIFLIFPIIYTMIQNGLLYIHISSAVQNSPQEQYSQGSNYGLAMNAPLLETQTQGPEKPAMTKTPDISMPTSTSKSAIMGDSSFNGSNSLSGMGGMGGMGGVEGWSL